MSFLKRIARRMPPGVVRSIGSLQFSIPMLGGLIRRLGKWAANGEGIIQSGIGKGLKIDASGGYFGYLAGTTEPEEQALLAKYVTDGTVFYDIGANVGFYTVIGARLVGAKGHVYAFEPFPISVQAIENNVLLNNFENVTIVEAAVSDTEGTVHFAIDDLSAKNKIVTEFEPETITTTVETIILDSWAATTGARPPDVVMIDVEGVEVEVLKGMYGLLSQHRPVLLCEVHWLGDKMAGFCRDVLEPLGYHFTTYSGEALPTEIVRYHLLAVAK